MSAPYLVLVVEDDPAVAEFLQLALRAMGHEVIVAPDGQAALDAAAENAPQLVLLDALLPKLDGFGVLRELRKLIPQVPILMMSGIYKKRSYQQEAVDLGAREYLFKPLSVLKIWELADRYLGEAAPGTPAPEGFAGTPLAEVPLARVLAGLLADGATGMLFVRGPEGTAILFVEEGRIVFGRSNDPQTRLDRVLESQNKLGAEAKRRAKELLDRSKGRARYGDLLVEAGLLSPEDLHQALAQQQRLHVTRPLTWTRGRSQFFHSEAPRHETFKLELDMEALVVWAARHVPAGPSLDAWLPPSENLLRAVRDLKAEARRFSLTPAELQLLALADGSRTVGALRAMGRLAQVDVDRLAAVLSHLGVLEAEEPSSRPAPRVGGALASAPAAGAVESHPPARVILGTSLAGRTGALRYEGAGSSSEAVRTVWFGGGSIAFANSNDPHDRLGQVLMRAGFVTTEQLRQALETAKSRPGCPLGRLLVDQGTLQLDDLHAALVAQVREVVAGLLLWKQGTFNFTSGPLPTQEIVPLALDPLELVLAALRGAPFSAIAAGLPANDARVRKTWQCFELAEQMELTPLEDRLLGELDRSPSVAGLLETLGENPEAVLRALNLLSCLGLIEQQPPEPAAHPQAQGASAQESRHEDGFAGLDGDESFGDEDFDAHEPEPAPQPASTSVGSPSRDEDFTDESFAATPSPPEGKPPGPSVTAGEDSFAGLGEGPLPAGSASGGTGGGPVTGAEDSFAGLEDEPLPEGIVACGAVGGPVTGAEDSFADLEDEPLPEGIVTCGAVGGSVTGAEDSFAGLEEAPLPEGIVTCGAVGGPVTGAEDSFAGLEEVVAAQEAREARARTSTGPLDEPSAATLLALGDAFPSSPLLGLVPNDGDGGASGAPFALDPTGRRAAVSTSAAVLEAPAAGGEELLFALQTFLALLSDHLSRHPGSVPEHVLAMLPAELRDRFGL